jgi:enoyl-CoA hydratase
MITIERDGPVARVLLDRPQRGNALSVVLLGALGAALVDLAGEVRGVILTGRGGVFSTGADLADLSGTTADVAYDDALAAVSAALRAASYPVVAAVEGRCIGAAVDLALSCDLVIAACDATFAVPATRLGILYAPAALTRLRRRAGSSGLRRLVLFGETLDGRDAHAAGLVDIVVEPGQTASRAAAAVTAAVLGLPAAVNATKQLLNAFDAATGDAADFEATRRTLLGSPERHQAIRERQRR